MKTVPVKLYVRGQFFRTENISESSYKFGSFHIRLIEVTGDSRREYDLRFKEDGQGDFVCNDRNAGILFQDSLSFIPLRQPAPKRKSPAHQKMMAELERLLKIQAENKPRPPL